MKTDYYDYNGIIYKKVSKRTAEKLFDLGVSIHLFPSRLRPFSGWILGGFVIDNDNVLEFEEILNQFSFYYNGNTETGKGICYYVAD